MSRPREPQTAAAVLMVRPSRFAANPETAASNFFQTRDPTNHDATARAQQEFAALGASLAAAGVRVIAVGGGARGGSSPDEVFPNNWLSLHADGTAVLYPLLAPSRRCERRPEILDTLTREHGFRLERVVDLTGLERRGLYLEGTGSLVLDRANRIAYAALSPRTHAEALAEFGRELGYETVAFEAVDRAGRAIYHTNVMLAIGTELAVLCTPAIVPAEARERVVARLEASGRELVDLTFEQLHAFAGNLLELRGTKGPVIALSAAALRSLDPRRRAALERRGTLVSVPVDTIERLGGGSVRCMLAEIGLPAA